MAKLVLVRHGETEWTRNDRIQGWVPVPLTENGQSQARAIGEYLSSELSVDRVLSSDVLRAYQTAEIVRESISSVPTIEIRTWLRERDFGLFQGLSNKTAEELRLFNTTNDGPQPLLRDGRGETWADVDARVQESWDRLVERTNTENIVLVTHTGVLISIIRYLRNLPEDEADSIIFNEGGITCVKVFNESHLEIEYQNKIDHLL